MMLLVSNTNIRYVTGLAMTGESGADHYILVTEGFDAETGAAQDLMWIPDRPRPKTKPSVCGWLRLSVRGLPAHHRDCEAGFRKYINVLREDAGMDPV